MTKGASLADALADESERGNVPPVYRAVVAVGLKSGRLPAALEAVAKLAQGYAETRRAIGQALAYPLFILVFAYLLFVGLVTELVPRFVDFAEGMHLPVSAPLAFLHRMGESVRYWAFGLPIALVFLLGIWLISGRAGGIQPGRFDRLARLIPWTRFALSQARAASFAELLALLIDHEVPLDEAVSLAGEATGEFSFREAANRAASAIRRGEFDLNKSSRSESDPSPAPLADYFRRRSPAHGPRASSRRRDLSPPRARTRQTRSLRLARHPLAGHRRRRGRSLHRRAVCADHKHLL